MKEDVVIVAARRSPIGKLGGALAQLSAVDLGAAVVKTMLDEGGVDPTCVDEVVMGQVLSGGAGQNPARQTALKAGLPIRATASTVNMVCGAGQKSLHSAIQAIRCGDAEVVIAGGQDSMTQAPHLVYGMRKGHKMGHVPMKDMMVVDGLWDAFHDVHMGETAEHLAERYQVTRAEQDTFAEFSQAKAARAIERQIFAEEIVPIDWVTSRGAHRVAEDEHPLKDTTLESLSRLKPVFRPDGTITAGNASGLNDGAAALLVMAAGRAEKEGLRPLARIAGYAAAAVEPMDMGIAPAFAARKALAKAGWALEDIDLLEINEAFAAQAIAVDREMGWNTEIVNVNGGAIALGHPLAASGTRIVVTLLHEMRRRQARRGLAALCIGGGQGIATCLELAD